MDIQLGLIRSFSMVLSSDDQESWVLISNQERICAPVGVEKKKESKDNSHHGKKMKNHFIDFKRDFKAYALAVSFKSGMQMLSSPQSRTIWVCVYWKKEKVRTNFFFSL